MAILGFGIIKDVSCETAAQFSMHVRAVICDGTRSEFELHVPLPIDSNSVQIQNAVIDAIKAKMTSDYGFTFGGGDVVKLIGLSLV